MPDSADPLPSSQPPQEPSAAAGKPDPDMPPRRPPAGGKLKKPLTDKLRAAAEQRLSHLRVHLRVHPLESPARPLAAAGSPHEAALRALGFIDFARLDLPSQTPRPDLVAQLIAYYDPANHRSFVRNVRVGVCRTDFARALFLPSKPASTAPPPDVEPAAVVSAVLEIMQAYVLLPFQGDDMCILPQEVAAAEQAVREGLAHRVDWAGLIWGLVEKEILELPKRDDGVCYYAAYLQRLIWAQKPKLFEPVEEEERGEVVLEVSVDADMDEEDGDADADADFKSKSLEELESGDADADAGSKSFEESELGGADLRSNSLDVDKEDGDADFKSKSLEELESGDADADAGSKSFEESELGGADLRSNNLEELESGGADVRSKSMEELELADADARSKRLEELEVADEDAKGTSLDESEAADEDAKGKSLDELGLGFVAVEGVAKGKSLDELGLGFVAVEEVAVMHEVVPANGGDAAEVSPEGDEGAAEKDAGTSAETIVVTQEEVDAGTSAETIVVTQEEVDAGTSAETIVVTQEEVLAVPEEVEEEADAEEVKDATGLSLGIGSANGYDSMDVEEDANVENLDEGDSGSEEAEESEDDAFEECRGGEEMNWRIGDEKGDGGMAHCLQRCNSSAFVGMEFENLNKGDVEMRDGVSFDDGFSGKMGSLHGMTSTNLLQAMNSIPATYNVTDNAHDLSSGEFLSMGADAHKNGVDLGTGSSFFFGNNGKRHIGDIGDIDGYNDHMQAQEQFPQSNQQKRMRNSNNSRISPVSAVFDANFSEPIQNLMAKASMFYEQKEKELQNALLGKQILADMLQEKETIIQSLNSARFEQQNKWQAELRRFEHDLNVMAQLITGYKKALKQSRASFDEYRKKFPCDKPRYGDVAGGGGLVLSVKELERKRLEEEQQKLAAANEMIEKFQDKWFSKLDGWKQAIHFLWIRMEELVMEIDLLKEKRKAKVATPATQE